MTQQQHKDSRDMAANMAAAAVDMVVDMVVE
jgi:hypothetical protein